MYADASLLNPSLGHNRVRAGRFQRPPRFLGPEYCGDLPVREALPWEDRYGPALLASVAANQYPVYRLRFRSEIFDIGVTGNGASHGLPVGNDHGWGFDDRTRPTEFLRSANLNAAGVEGDPAGLNLFNGHAAILRFLAVFVRQLDEVNEVRVQEGDTVASRVHDLPAAEVETIPFEEVQKGGDGENGRRAFCPCGRRQWIGFDAVDQRGLSVRKDFSIIDGFRVDGWEREVSLVAKLDFAAALRDAGAMRGH